MSGKTFFKTTVYRFMKGFAFKATKTLSFEGLMLATRSYRRRARMTRSARTVRSRLHRSII